ncbi:MAG: M81 family metallopeptidase [Candidatus Latescibacteria bacterium]|mgnify:CR=1 FL=1|jgi:microcystin degradation protein MlrC|nr:M81 family metallopeptidase [Candidatus Latescibacterota bacterium]
MRIAVCGIAVECCSFSPLPTRLEDFAILRGEALLSDYSLGDEYEDIDFVPVLRARAIAGGPVLPDAYDQIKTECLDGLSRNGPWDGVYLDLHGAMFVQGMRDAEGDWVAAVREAVGPDCLIGASYDLHGNVSTRVMRNLDFLTAYRTAPHIDREETRSRAIELLVGCLRRGTRPISACVSIPTLFSGEMAMTTAEPAQGLYADLPATIERHGLLDASYLVGYAWADEPRVASSAVAVGLEQASVEDAARELALAWWENRSRFGFGMPSGSINDCIRMAIDAARHDRPVFISDAGDNPTGGGVGDVPIVLERMLAAGVDNTVFAAIADADAVAACFAAGAGNELTLSIGGKLDPVHGAPLEVTGKVVGLLDAEPGNRHAVLRIAGLKTVLTERRTAFTGLAQFEALGIDLTQHDVVGVKQGYLFPELGRLARSAFLAMSPGAINPDIGQIPYRHLTRPIYPLDPDMQWEPQVHIRGTKGPAHGQ